MNKYNVCKSFPSMSVNFINGTKLMEVNGKKTKQKNAHLTKDQSHTSTL